MACIHLEVAKEAILEDIKKLNADELKQSRYTADSITDEMLSNFFNDSEIEAKQQYSELFGEDGSLAMYKSAIDKTRALQNFASNNMPFGDVVGKMKDGKEARYKAIAISHLLSVIESEKHAVNKYNLSEEDKVRVSDLETGNINTSLSNMARVIGRDILKSRGYRLVPKDDQGLEMAIAEETKLGMEAINMLGPDVVSISDNGSVINRGFMEANRSGKPFQDRRDKVIEGVKTITIKDIFKANPDNKKHIDQANRSISSKLAATYKLILPTNVDIPSKDTKEVRDGALDIDITDNTYDLLEKIQKSSMTIHPFVEEFIDELQTIISKESNSNTSSTLSNLVSMMSDGSMSSPYLFGTIDKEDIKTLMAEDSVGIEKEYGRSNNKVEQFVRLLDDWENLKGNPLHFSYQIASQNRAHTIEQTLNFQSDAFLSRNILGSKSEQTISDKKYIDYMIDFIVDETGLSKEVILGNSNDTEANSKLDYYLDTLDSGMSAFDTITSWATHMGKSKDNLLFDKTKSVWETYAYVQGIKDLRDGLSGDGKVRTRFMPKPDATASGAVITDSQAAGRTEAAGEVINRLRDDTDSMNDMYELATDEVSNRIKDSKNIPSANTTKQSKMKNMILADKLINEAKLLPSARELIKMPFTTFMYGQADYNNVIETSKTLADEIMSNGNDVAIKLILGNVPENRSIIREQLIAKLSEKNGLSKELVDIVSETTGNALFNEQAKMLTDIHDLLEKAVYLKDSKYDSVHILPPLAALEQTGNLNDNTTYSKARKAYGANLEKFMEAVIDSTDGNLTTVKKRSPNRNSIRVLLQHMTDAAIMFRAIDRLLKTEKYKDYDDGIMLIHDSIAGTVEFAKDLEEMYQEEIVIVNAEYDFVETALQELRFAKSKIPEGKLSAEMDKLISKLETNLASDIQKKKDILYAEKTIPNTFGVKPKVSKVNEKIPTEVSKKKTKVEKSKKTSTTEQVEATPDIVLESKAAKDYVINRVGNIKDTVVRNIAKVALNKNPTLNIVVNNKNVHKYDLKTNTVYIGETSTVEKVVHELVHAATAQQIEKSKGYQKRVQSLYDHVVKRNPDIMKQFEVLPKEGRLHEFLAKGITNSNLAKDLEKISYGRKILTKIKDLVLEVFGIKPGNNVYSKLAAEFFSTNKYNETSDNRDLTLYFTDSLKDTYRTHEVKTDSPKTVFEGTSDIMSSLDAKAARAIQYTIDLSADTIANKLKGKTYHEKMMKEYPLYAETINNVNDVWNNNTFINKLRIYLDADNGLDKNTLNLMKTQAHNAENNKLKFEQQKVKEITQAMKGLFTKEEETKLYSVLSETPIYHLNPDGILHSIMNNETTVDQAISDSINNSGLKPERVKEIIRMAKAMSELYVNKNVTPGALHTSKGFDPGKPSTKLLDKLTALYSLQLIPDSETLLHKANSTDKHKAAISKLLELSSAIKVLDDELYNSIEYKNDTHNGNLNYTTFKGNMETKVVTMDNISHKLESKLGWKVLRKPTKDSAGIIYRDAGDPAYQSGIATGIRINPNIQPITYGNTSLSQLKANNALPMDNGMSSRIILTNDEMTTLGAERDVIQSLVKAYSHKQLILETESIRQTMVDQFTYKYSSDIESKIVKDIKERKHMWYMHLPEGVTLADMPKEIQNTYKVAKASSDVNNFSNKVTLVREDMSDFVEGYKELQIGKEGTTLNKAFNILKKSILLQKIHWVIVNPVKLAMDATSNIAYLLSKNMPITFLYRSYKEDASLFHSLTKIREELIHAEFADRIKSTPSTKAKIVNLENQIKNHKLATAHYNGFVSSISIDLIGNNEHVATGIHNDISTLLNKLLKNGDDLNAAGKAIMTFSKFGVNIEDVLMRIADKKKGTKDESSVTETLEEMAEHIKTIKDRNDVAAYIQEFLATPGSSLVGVGSMMNQMNDFLSKNALYKFLVEQNVKKWENENKKKVTKEAMVEIHKEAVDEALTAFIDYKKNMPRELRFLEQTGVTNFISFWSRIQRVIFNSLKNNPVNAMLTIGINEMFGLSSTSILSADVFGRMSDGRIVGTPSFGLDVLFPTKMLG